MDEAAASAAAGPAPKVTPADIDALIAAQYTWVAGDIVRTAGQPEHAALSKLTIAVVILTNGWTLVGKSAPVSSDNYDPEIGTARALDDAKRQIWPLAGFLLAERQYQEHLAKLAEEGVHL